MPGDNAEFGRLIDGPFAGSKLRPTKPEILLAGLIWQHRGRERPLSIARLRELTGVNERAIKGIVEQLIVAHKMRIGGRREEPAGYFMIEDSEDQAAAVGPYKAQILAMLRRLRVLESREALREFLGQLRLEAEG
jgi:hypothetical protein